jgi:hypothetical protein
MLALFFPHVFHYFITASLSSARLPLPSPAIVSLRALLVWIHCNPVPVFECASFHLSLSLTAIRLTAVLEPIVRALASDDDFLVRRAAAGAILISLRPYNVDNAKTVSTIAGSNLRFVRTPYSPHPNRIQHFLHLDSIYYTFSINFMLITSASELARSAACPQ